MNRSCTGHLERENITQPVEQVALSSQPSFTGRCRNMSDKAPEPWSFDNEGPTTTLSKKLLSNASISRMSSTISLHPLPDSHETSTEKAAQNTLLGMIAVALGAGFSCTGGSLVVYIPYVLLFVTLYIKFRSIDFSQPVLGGSVLNILLVRWTLFLVLGFTWWFLKGNKGYGHRHWYGDPGNRRIIWWRGFLYCLQMWGWYRGLQLVPIGDAETLIFVSPLLIVLIARVYLKESLPKVFPATFIMTIAGTVMVSQPTFLFASDDTANPVSTAGFLSLMIMVVCWAVTTIMVRTAAGAHWLQMQLVTAVQGFLITILMILINRFVLESEVLSGDVTPGITEIDIRSVGLAVAIGLCGFGGMMFYVIGYQIGDATKVASMEYLDLIYGFAFQWFMFGLKPNIYEILGLCCLLSTCIFHLAEEWLHYKNAKRIQDGIA